MGRISSKWKGFLTTENIDDVATALLEMLDGKTFAVASTTPSKSPIPVVRPGMQLCFKKIHVEKGDHKNWNYGIRIYYTGFGSVEDAFYVLIQNPSKANKYNSAYFEFSYHGVEITLPKRMRFGGREYQAFRTQE